VKNVSFGIFDPSLGIFDPARIKHPAKRRDLHVEITVFDYGFRPDDGNNF